MVDRHTGAVVHDRSLGKQVRYAPVMHQGWLYVPTTTGDVLCLNTKDPTVHGWPMLLRNAAHAAGR